MSFVNNFIVIRQFAYWIVKYYTVSWDNNLQNTVPIQYESIQPSCIKSNIDLAYE